MIRFQKQKQKRAFPSLITNYMRLISTMYLVQSIGNQFNYETIIYLSFETFFYE